MGQLYKKGIIESFIHPKFIILILIVSGSFAHLMAQTQHELVYKEIDTLKLKMVIYNPENIVSTQTYPAMIFFFGGGWETGNISQFQYYATSYAKKGMITILADYRVSSRNNSTPIESLKDAKSAIRFLKMHADSLQIDTTRLAASGGSAGGQLAAACFTNETFNEVTDPMQFTSKPKALVLFNPVIDNSPTGYGYEKLGDNWEAFSPLNNVHPVFPPTTFFLGTSDNLVPVSTAQLFKQKIEAVGGRCDLHLFKDAEHGFFNLAENRDQVILVVDTFLQSIGYLPYDERMTQTINFPSLETKYLNDVDFDPGAVPTSGLPVAYTCSDPNVATVVDGKIHITGKGSSIVTAHQQGNEVYSPAPDVSRVLVVSSQTDSGTDYWIDVDFTRDSTMWKTAFPMLAVNGLNLQCSPSGEYLGFGCTGAFGKFAVSNYVYTPFNLENLNEKFIYSYRISTNKTNQWIFPVLPNIGKIKVHYLSGSNVGSTIIPLQKNIAETGQSPNWVDFDPKIEITAPPHGFSANSFVFEKELNLDGITQLRFAPSSNYNFCFYAVSISKNLKTDIKEEVENDIKINLAGRSLQVTNNNFDIYSSIYTVAGLKIGDIKKNENFIFQTTGIYILAIKTPGKTITKKITVI